MPRLPFTFSAQVILTVQQDQILLVAEENYVILNFKDHGALERVMLNVMPPASSGMKGGWLTQLEKARDLSAKLNEAGVIVDVRVNNKTYVEIGSSNTPKLTANAVLGKVGSWFK